MARIEPRIATLRTGHAVRIRSLEPSDAPAQLAFRLEFSGTHEYDVTQRDEIDDDDEAQARWIRDHLEGPRSLAIIAEPAVPGSDPPILGVLSFRGHAQRRMAHHGSFGIGVHAGWRSRGVGRALITTLIEWARAHPEIEQLRLGVFAPNAPAIALYRSLGFVEEARLPAFFKIGPGRYVDDIQMSLQVKPRA